MLFACKNKNGPLPETSFILHVVLFLIICAFIIDSQTSDISISSKSTKGQRLET